MHWYFLKSLLTLFDGLCLRMILSQVRAVHFFEFLEVDCNVFVLDNSDEVMNSLGLTYCDLGRHQDALVLHEKVLESCRRVLPTDDPLIVNACLFWSIV
jgi:hypothetical protein